MKKLKVVVSILGFAVLLNGCSHLKAETALSTQDIVQNQESEITRTTSQTPDIIGEISEIVGNEVTVKIVNMPEGSQINEVPEKRNPQADDTNQAEEKKAPRAITGSADGGLGGGPGGAFPGGGFQRGDAGGQRTGRQVNAGGDAAGARAALKLDYTGEEKTITIPVGMTIAGGRGQNEMTFESLQEGNVISIWLDEAQNIEKINLFGGGSR
ncbi:hypothetical protein [Cellulosilyticum sp. I15G10I2]|uniref:hypothetical protein n=1 Tax=Cellulosilyticum sp. I15G10I2 TaxID=1892843 RepID=UPI00085C8177|nr:hypothetical protein [Cellulosilyticum sp. I15G10I2]